jgi:hypothetical protein
MSFQKAYYKHAHRNDSLVIYLYTDVFIRDKISFCRFWSSENKFVVNKRFVNTEHVFKH